MKHSVSCPVNCPACSTTSFVNCGGNAKPTDLHLLSTVHCVDEEIFDFLKRREHKMNLKTKRRLSQ